MKRKYTFFEKVRHCYYNSMNYWHNWYHISLFKHDKNNSLIFPFGQNAEFATLEMKFELAHRVRLDSLLLDHEGKNNRLSGSYALAMTATKTHNIRMLMTPVLIIWSKFPCKWFSNSYIWDCKIASSPWIPSAINSLFTVSFVSSRCTSWKSTFEHFGQEHFPPRYLGSVFRYSDRTFSYVVSPSIFNFFRVTGFRI